MTARKPLALLVLYMLLAADTSFAALELRNAERVDLDNGLTVLLLEDRNFPVVSVQMLYRIGARNEVTGKTGLAHFLEHMAFRATEKFPDTEVVSRIYGQGGEWHGYTWTDQTTYFATVPREDLDLLLDIEAERMARLVIDPAYIEAERGAVLAEMHMYENDPATMLVDALLYTAFLAHPYRNNTIGWESDINSVTHADVVDFYAAHYHPANAVLAVVGDFDQEAALERIQILFGDMEKRPRTPLPHTVEPLQQGERRIVLSGPSPQRRFVIGYHAPAVGHPDYAAFLVLQEILAGGSGVSFLQNDWGTSARETGLLHGAADDVTSWFPPSAQDYLFVIGGTIAEERAEQDAEQEIERRIATLRATPPSRDRVGTAVSAVLDELVFDVQTTEDAAHQLAFFTGLDALDLLLSLPDRLQRVTAADITRVAQTYLRADRRTIGWYRPGEPQRVAAAGQAAQQYARPSPARPDGTPVGPAVLRKLGNGLPAIVQNSDLSSSVHLKLVVRGAQLSNDEFAAGDPEPGALAWNGSGRPAALAQLAAAADAALDAARHGGDMPAPGSTDPETRLREEFGAVMKPASSGAGETVRPAVVVVAGDVDPGATFALLERHFGRHAEAAAPAPIEVVPPAGRRKVELGQRVAQSQLGYIVAAPAPSAPGYAAWRLLQYILAHGYEGRLGKEAISRRGLAYYVDARYSSDGGPGWTTLSIGVDTHKIRELERVMAAEFARLASEPPSQAEVDDAKRHLLGRLVSAAQANEELTAALASHWMRYGTTPSLGALRERLDAVTLADVRALVPIFTSGLTIEVTP